MQIFLGNGFGGFTVGQNVVINPQCNNINAVDLNKDGNLDLVLAGAGSDNMAGLFISTYLGDGAGNFTLHQAIDVGEGAIRGLISLGDFNEDGNMDVAYPLSSDGVTRHDFSTDLLIYLGDGTGNFTQGQTVTVGQEPGSTWTADFNKDGHIGYCLHQPHRYNSFHPLRQWKWHFYDPRDYPAERNPGAVMT